jgi:hypothetical protein
MPRAGTLPAQMREDVRAAVALALPVPLFAQPVKQLAGHGGAAYAVAFNPDSDKVLNGQRAT